MTNSTPTFLMAKPRNTPAVFDDVPKGMDSTLSATFKVVAVRGVYNQWAAYFGPNTWSDELVHSQGDKLPVDAARMMFPNITGEYRD